MLKLKIFLSLLLIVFFKSYGAKNTSILEVGEKLKVDVKFTIPDDPVKYIVYAGEDMSDKISLPPFYLSQDPAKAGFISEPPKVYTKRIVNGKIEDLQGSDRVIYVLTHPDGYMPTVPADTMVPEGGINLRLAINYLPKSTLEEIINVLGDDYEINERGNIMQKGTKNRYASAALIEIKSHKGELTIRSKEYDEKNKIPLKDIKKVERFIGERNGVPMANISFKVIIE